MRGKVLRVAARVATVALIVCAPGGVLIGLWLLGKRLQKVQGKGDTMQ
jgi:hypothetical protein